VSAGSPAREARKERGPAGIRTVRIIGAILLLLLILVLAIGVLRRFHAAPGGGQAIVKKAPPPPGNLNAPDPAVARPTAAATGSPGREAGDPQPPGAGRGAPPPPLVLDDGELRIFIDGTGPVSLPVVVRETGARLIVESASGGRPAEVLVAADRDRTAAVSVLSGAAVIAAGGRRVRVGAGTFTAVPSGSPPALPEPLPPSPDLAAPSDDAVFVYGTLPPRITFSWRARGAADGFRFVLARDPGFRNIVMDERLPGPRVTQDRLEEGTYYWRVSAVAKGVAGPPGDAARFRIARRGTPPELLVRPVTRVDGGNVCLVTGMTDPGAKVFVAGAPVPVTATGSFSCRVRLDGSAGAIVVEALDPLGNAAYHSQWEH